MNNYLIPANTSRGKLIFGLFREIDLVIFLSGLGVTFLLLMILPLDEINMAILAVTPAIICALLTAPLPYYHNVLTALVEIYEFFTRQRKYVWKGWCMSYGTEDEGQNSRGLDQRPGRNQ